MLKKLGIKTATASIKTWANAWTTSTRIHESQCLRCIFGCDAKDDLIHYLDCDPLWTSVISCSFKRTELLWTAPLSKLGLHPPSAEWLQMNALAFACYHSLKHSHFDTLLATQESGNPDKVHDLLISFACAHAKDIIVRL